jgi:hypothetical protein
MTDMTDRIATVTMECAETGEKIDVGQYYFFPTGFEMTVIALVKSVETYGPHPDGTEQIDARCMGLDSSGMPFDLDVNFVRHSPEETAALLSDMATNSVHILCGQYGIDDKGAIGLTDPTYREVQPDFDENEVREAFRINVEYRANVALLLSERPEQGQ